TGRVSYINNNFSSLKKSIADLNLPQLQIGGIYADLGVSSMQLDQAKKGFSFRMAGPLKMNFDSNGLMSAEDIVNNWSVDEIAQLIIRYGEDTFGPVIAKAIGEYRQQKRIADTCELAQIIASVKQRRGSKIHPATKTFQALRIVVNDELGQLAEFLEQAVSLLPSKRRLVVITYHSLEDRVVKQYFKKESTDCLCPKELPVCFCHHRARLRLISKKSIRPAAEEIKTNPRSRSAKLRVVEKI
ncbi:MAG: 16S rRNA (cytosine(1402)-N(4))-methyltransferase, partial [Candidatus Komeilibacteria bacterium CG_4_9_14_3_um_filter_37_5]